MNARILACLVFLGALLVYKVTLHPGFFPGESARQVAVALFRAPNTTYVQRTVASKKDAPVVFDRRRQVRTDKSVQYDMQDGTMIQEHRMTLRTRYRVWSLVSSLFARHVPIGSLDARMNSLPAFFGALNAALLFALVRSLLLLLNFHISPLPANRRKTAATLAGLAAAVALSAAIPCWIAATRCLPHTFEIFLMLASGYLMLMSGIRHNEHLMFVAAFLLGIGLLEAEEGVWMAPLMLFFAARAIRTGGLGFTHGGVALLSGVVFGVMGYLIINWLGPHGGAGSPFMLPFREMTQTLRSMAGTLSGGWLRSAHMVVMACFVVLPLLATVAMLVWGDQDLTGVSTMLMLLTLLGTTTFALTGGSFSPWGAYRSSTILRLPCTLFLLAALVVGFLMGKGCLMAGGRILPDITRGNRRRGFPGDDDEGGESPLGRLIMGYLCVLLIATGAFNFREVMDWREPLAGKVAAETVRRLDGRRWVVADGMQGLLIRLHGRMAGKPVALLAFNDTPGRLPSAWQIEALLGDPAFAGLNAGRLRQMVQGTNPVSFVQALLTLAPRAEEHVLVLRDPDLWRRAGRHPLPDVVGFRGAPADGGINADWQGLLQEHHSFWDQVEELPALGPYAPVWIRGQRATVRQQLHDVGTCLADELARAGHTEDAQAALNRANRIKEEPLPSAQDIFY